MPKSPKLLDEKEILAFLQLSFTYTPNNWPFSDALEDI
jgi:hypothetical protein